MKLAKSTHYLRKLKSSVILLILLILFWSFISLWAQDVITRNGMVASAHPLASEAGEKILKSGGNAIDAAMATAFALSIVEPNASGLGGGGFILFKMTDQQNVMMLDYREKAPGAAVPEVYYRTTESFDSLCNTGGPVVGVPGMVAGLFLLHQKFGSFPIEKVLQPAIDLGDQGVAVTPKLASIITLKYDLISKHDLTSQIFLADLLPPESGSIIKNVRLPISIKMLAQNGIEEFYEGGIGVSIVKSVRENGGWMVSEDLNEYQPKFRDAVHGTYRAYDIYSCPPPGSGICLIQLLNILEGYDLKEIGSNNARYFHLLAEAMKMVFVDREAYLGDPDFTDVPVQELGDKAYAKFLRGKIKPDRAVFDYQPLEMSVDESGSTSHLSVVDQQDNIVALTQTINNWFGSGITAEGTGILLNDEIRDFSEQPGNPNSIFPGKRPASSMAPTIIFKDGKPFLTIGSPGATRIISALAQTLINIIDFHMSIDDAIEVPRIHSIGEKLYVEGRIPEETIKELTDLGHHVEIKKDFDNYFGGAQGILINQETDMLHGGADSRRDGVAVGF
jgi:gamma-glutamyltranspeptidase/glutathione hydrolase